LEKDGPGKNFIVPDWIVDDWTGTKFSENILCYGKSPCPSAPIDYPKIKNPLKKEEGSLI
jgi:hypothetical protein